MVELLLYDVPKLHSTFDRMSRRGVQTRWSAVGAVAQRAGQERAFRHDHMGMSRHPQASRGRHASGRGKEDECRGRVQSRTATTMSWASDDLSVIIMQKDSPYAPAALPSPASWEFQGTAPAAQQAPRLSAKSFSSNPPHILSPPTLIFVLPGYLYLRRTG